MYTQVCIWVNTILNHIDTMGILHRFEGSCMMYRPNRIKIREILITDTQMMSREDVTRSELVRTYTLPTHGTHGALGNFPSPRELACGKVDKGAELHKAP